MSQQWITSLRKKMRNFDSVIQHIWGLFISSERKPGWKNLLQIFAICCTVGFIISSFLFLALYSSLPNYPLISLAISASIWIGFSILLWSSTHVRCFGSLFVLSCGLREVRNAFIAAGTGVMVSGNIQSIFRHLKMLADCITCNIEAEQFAFIKHYFEILKWIYNQAKLPGISLQEVVPLTDKFDFSYLISDEKLKMKLNTTKQQIQSVANHISSILAIQFPISQQQLPILGILLVLFGTCHFLRKFLGTQSVKFKNIYITKQFIEFDEHQRQQQKPCVLPFSKKEKKVYVRSPSLWRWTHKERKRIKYFLIPVFTNLCIWVLFAAVDYLFYKLTFSVSKHLQAVPELQVNLTVSYQNNEKRFVINNGELKTANVPFNISLFKHDCLPKPEFSLSSIWIQLGCIIFYLIFALLSATLTQLRVLVSTSFYPDIEMKRIHYLHAKLLRKRSVFPQKNVKRKLNSFAAKFHFWFPVFKAIKMVRKKEKDMINMNNI
uniref:Dendrocyte expressed seven transmembrane protein n=1 Tax=Pelusios castaneus TaxID=367368 RepID=A0A8C8RWH7_9SAUR